MTDCPHCGHDWVRHHKQCEACGCYWPNPERLEPAAGPIPIVEYPYEGVISADQLYEAFWDAAEALGDDATVHGMEQPYFDKSMDMVDASGCGIPSQFWQHMLRALMNRA